MAWLLGLHSYLLGQQAADEAAARQQPEQPVAEADANAEHVAAQPEGDNQEAEQAAEPAPPAPPPAPRQAGGVRPRVFQRIHDLVRLDDAFREREDYVRPHYFALRVCDDSVGVLSLLRVSICTSFVYPSFCLRDFLSSCVDVSALVDLSMPMHIHVSLFSLVFVPSPSCLAL